MKTKISLAVLFIIIITSFITVMGQEKTDIKKKEADQKKKELYIIRMDSARDAEMDLQKAMDLSLKAEEQALKARKLNGYIDNKEFYRQADAIKKSQKQLQEGLIKTGENWDVVTAYGAPSIAWSRSDHDRFNMYNFNEDNENTSLGISKSLEDVTFSTDFTYDVKKETSNISFYVSGTLKAGELKITLKKPDKTAFQEFTISPLADVNWNQQFNWDEEESEGYLGKWIISISANKAVGTYRVKVNSR